MKISNILLRTFVFVLLIGCNSSDRSSKHINKELLTLNLDDHSFKKCNYSQVFEVSNIVSLEETENSMLGGVDQIVSYKGYFFVLDLRVSKGIYQFTHDGKFIKKFGSIGKGPEEYVNPFKFAINKTTDEILILDTSLRKIIIYSLNGKFKKTIQLLRNSGYRSIESMDDYIYLFSNNRKQEHLITIINYDGKQVKQLLKHNTESRINMHFGKNVFYQNNNNIVFCQPYLYDIYQIKGLKIKSIIRLASNSFINKADIDKVNNASPRELYEIMKDIKCHWGINSYIENSTLWSFRMETSPRIILGVVNTNNTKVIEIAKDDLTFIKAPFVTATKDALVSLIDPYFKNRVIRELKSGKIDVGKNKKTVIQKIKSENPVLVLYKLKK